MTSIRNGNCPDFHSGYFDCREVLFEQFLICTAV